MTGPIPWFFRLIVRLGVWPDWNGSELLSMKHGLPVALIEEVLARVILSFLTVWTPTSSRVIRLPVDDEHSEVGGGCGRRCYFMKPRTSCAI